MKTKPFPKDLYISRNDEGTEDEYLQTNETPEETAEVGVTKNIAHYKLCEMLEVECKIETTVR